MPSIGDERGLCQQQHDSLCAELSLHVRASQNAQDHQKLARMLPREGLLKGGTHTRPRENGTICPLGVFPLFYSNFLAELEANPCSEATCGVVSVSPCFIGISGGFGVLEP